MARVVRCAGPGDLAAARITWHASRRDDQLYEYLAKRFGDRVAFDDVSFEVARDLCGSLSKGLRQRVALARPLLNDPAVLFPGEPTAPAIGLAAALLAFDLLPGASWPRCSTANGS